MRLVVGLLQPLRRDVRVNLRRDEVRVAEQFLHAAQIRAGIEQVRGVAVTQFVRGQARVQPGDHQIVFQPPRELHAVQRRSLPVVRVKDRLRPHRRFLQRRPVTGDRLQRRRADGHQPLFFSLAANPHHLFVKINILHAQVYV